MDAVEAANSGHPGMPMGMADAAVVLFSEQLRFDPRRPDWPDRDRFVLSAGHGSMLLYSLLHLTGYPGMTIDELKRFRQIGSKTPGHPEYGHAAGVETTTGPLGQGFGNAVGMAIAERHLNARFGDDLVDHRTWVIAGDGCLMEGISHESASLAGHLGLGRLNVLWDDNHISIDGPTSLTQSDDVQARFRSYGWHVVACDGHDAASVSAALAEAAADPRPSPPFEIPSAVAAVGRRLGDRGATEQEAWLGRLEAVDPAVRAEFERVMAGKLPEDLADAVQSLKATLASDPPKLATRVASQRAIEAMAPVMPELLGGSADLSGSNNTKVKSQHPFTRDDAAGSYLHYGVREHAMAAAMNGMALHGGVVPYGGTFLVFTDYCRPSIRLAALMGIRVVFVMTHDSIGLGEDGPTHQPVEHLAALRCIPNLHVHRPADAIETAECWQLALERADGPSVLALTRQGLPAVRTVHSGDNRARRGGYVLFEADGDRQVTLIATGSEVDIARKARDLLAADGIGAAVVSMPCRELFAGQDAEYRAQVLGDGAVRVVVEAGVRMPWEADIGPDGGFIGMSGFGASGPAEELYKHFGITPQAVADEARRLLAAKQD